MLLDFFIHYGLYVYVNELMKTITFQFSFFLYKMNCYNIKMYIMAAYTYWVPINILYLCNVPTCICWISYKMNDVNVNAMPRRKWIMTMIWRDFQNKNKLNKGTIHVFPSRAYNISSIILYYYSIVSTVLYILCRSL